MASVSCYQLSGSGTKTAKPFEVVRCLHPLELAHADEALFIDEVGIVVIYTCHFGFRFGVGGSVRSAVCVDGDWIAVVEECEGILP